MPCLSYHGGGRELDIARAHTASTVSPDAENSAPNRQLSSCLLVYLRERAGSSGVYKESAGKTPKDPELHIKLTVALRRVTLRPAARLDKEAVLALALLLGNDYDPDGLKARGRESEREGVPYLSTQNVPSL